MGMTEWSETYKGYVLKCDPQMRPDGKFAPHIAIEERAGSAVKVHVVPLDAPECDTEREAAQIGRFNGRHWVDYHG